MELGKEEANIHAAPSEMSASNEELIVIKCEDHEADTADKVGFFRSHIIPDTACCFLSCRRKWFSMEEINRWHSIFH
jgi:hypothetical protein